MAEDPCPTPPTPNPHPPHQAPTRLQSPHLRPLRHASGLQARDLRRAPPRFSTAPRPARSWRQTDADDDAAGPPSNPSKSIPRRRRRRRRRRAAGHGVLAGRAAAGALQDARGPADAGAAAAALSRGPA